MLGNQNCKGLGTHTDYIGPERGGSRLPGVPGVPSGAPGPGPRGAQSKAAMCNKQGAGLSLRSDNALVFAMLGL